jgi:hypothetical protein
LAFLKYPSTLGFICFCSEVNDLFGLADLS